MSTRYFTYKLHIQSSLWTVIKILLPLITGNLDLNIVATSVEALLGILGIRDIWVKSVGRIRDIL